VSNLTKLLSIPIAIATLTIATLPAFANSPQPAQPQRVRWTPNPKLGSAQRTLSGGRRGQAIAHCETTRTIKPTALTLLVPQTNQGLATIEANPTFFWHTQTDRPTTAKFILSDPSTAEPIFTQTIQVDRAGISRLTPPVQLKAGVRYRWTVLLACNTGTPKEVIARSFVERLENVELQWQARTLSDLDRAATFAQNGIWFDTIEALITAAEKNPQDLKVKSELRSLLSQVGKPSIEVAQVLEAMFGS
jgi:Domain of Unknown Function (DUF928)